MNPKIFELSKTEEKELQAHSDAGLDLARELLNTSDDIDYAKLDKAFAALAANRDSFEFNNLEVANMLGSYFATLLQSDLALSWFNISDKYGEEKALVCDKTQSVIFPINTVLKRLEPEMNTEAFFKPMSETIKKHINF